MARYQVISCNGIEMAYRAWGAPAAPPMVLLHALGESAPDWEDVAPPSPDAGGYMRRTCVATGAAAGLVNTRWN